MNSPLVSVILPTYNRASVLERSISSVFGQSFTDWELLIVDDGSNDGTDDILERFSNDSRVKIIRISRAGVSAARNFAAQAAVGSWLAFLDSDDEWLDHKLSLQLELARESGHKLIHGEELWIRNGVRVNPMKKHAKGGGNQFLRGLDRCIISPSCAMICKELFFELGGFRNDYPVCEDYDLWLKYTSLYPVGFVQTPIVVKYGGHEDQLSRQYFAMDYWRVKSLLWLLFNRKLSDTERAQVKKVAAKKLKVLRQGAIKHNNLELLAKLDDLLPIEQVCED